MSKSKFSEEFKRQIADRGYPVYEVSQHLGVSQHFVYEWKKKWAALDVIKAMTRRRRSDCSSPGS